VTVNPDTNYFFFENREALVLAGGGARAAYQVGVLRAIADWLPKNAPCPFEVLVGTSAGAINATAIASYATHFAQAVNGLERVWSNFTVDQVMRVNRASMLRAGLQWLFSLVSFGHLLPPPRALLDTSPLRELLPRVLRLDELRERMAAGPVQALAVAATSYASGRAVAFFEARPGIEEWTRVRRAGIRRAIDLEVLMASSAIPFIFPAASVGGEYYGDGAMRQLAPLSPAVHLGANRLLVVGTRVGAAASLLADSPDPPSPGDLLGFVLDSLFADGLSIDLERLQQVNGLLLACEGAAVPGRKPIDTLVIQPSVDPTMIARKHVDRLPRSLRALLRTIGALEARGGLLVSYLLFDSAYTRELMRLGRADAEARRREILEFIREDTETARTGQHRIRAPDTSATSHPGWRSSISR
jgi:NTE family protein